jgi:drug/metabolite transporter (DMT)-like permease
MSQSSQRTIWPYVIIILGFTIGATGPILIRLAQSEGMPSLIITAYRQIFSLLVITPLVLRGHWHEIRQLTRHDFWFAALAGIIMAVRFVILFEAYNNTSVLITGVLNGSSPLWVALTEVAFLKASFNRNIWAGLTFALLGGTLIGLAGFDGGTSLGNNPTLGVIFALSGAFLSAFYLNIGRSLRARVSFLPYLWLVFGFAAITCLVATFFSGMSLTGYSVEAYAWVFILTITAQLIAHGAVNYVLAFVSATFVSISAQIANVASAILAYFIFAELPTGLQVIGSVIIVAGVIIATTGRVRERAPQKVAK